MKSKISMHQTAILVVLCLLSNKILLLPSLLYGEVKADAIFVMIALFALDIIALPIFFRLKRRFPDKKLVEILTIFLTKVVAKLILTILLVYMLFKTLLTFSIVYDYFKQHIYQDEFIWIAIVCIIPVMNHAVLSGLKPSVRTMELFFGAIITGILIIFFISLFTHTTVPFFFNATSKELVSGFSKFTFAFGDFTLLFLIIDRVDYKKSQEKQVYLHSLFAILIVLAVFFIFYAKYPVTAFMHNNALADILVFSVQFNAIGRLDIIAMITIMTLATFQMEIFCHGFCESFEGIFPLLNKKWAVGTFDVAFFLFYYLYIGKFEVMISSSVSWLAVVGGVVSYILPIIFFVLSHARRKNE